MAEFPNPNFSTVDETIFDKGFFAASRGYPEFECPYLEGSPQAKEWLRGHEVACRPIRNDSKPV